MYSNNFIDQVNIEEFYQISEFINYNKFIDDLIKKNYSCNNFDKLSTLREIINSSNEKKLTILLFWSCKTGNIRNVEIILKRISQEGLNIDINFTFCQAIVQFHLKIAEMMVNYNADVNFLGGKPLILAVMSQQLEMVELLLNIGAKPNLIGEFIITECIKMNRADILELILKYEIDIGPYYKSIMQICLNQGKADCACKLIQYNVNVLKKITPIPPISVPENAKYFLDYENYSDLSDESEYYSDGNSQTDSEINSDNKSDSEINSDNKSDSEINSDNKSDSEINSDNKSEFKSEPIIDN
ncbi:putative ankyrin repeat protein [Cotonvirus japonicus]|uniref:Ankyrin repeat protein n=1 Tax=Cotonvirus japonicus TaxID=2811091 RepID=A0ABM7NRW7_9VIRU|nr:putative ankyrin repeat protein [Cotonvirus japonicus]BCS82904.1 putative ankyrin repeat protein [Cotonvirus japonicus]